MLDISVGVDRQQLKSIDQTLQRFTPRILKIIKTDVAQGLKDARQWMKAEYLSGGPTKHKTTSKRLARRSGALQRSLKIAVRVDGTQLVEGRLFVDPASPAAVYAPVHEFGATIVPRTAKMLAIPLTRTAERAGGPRLQPGLHLFVSKKGNVLLANKSGEPQWVLKDKVVIPARPFMAPTAERYLPRIVKTIMRDVQKLLATNAGERRFATSQSAGALWFDNASKLLGR